MNSIYDNGSIMLGNIDLVIEELQKEIANEVDMNEVDMFDTSTEELLIDLIDLKKQVPNVSIVCINYDTGMGYSFDYWRTDDEIKEV